MNISVVFAFFSYIALGHVLGLYLSALMLAILSAVAIIVTFAAYLQSGRYSDQQVTEEFMSEVVVLASAWVTYDLVSNQYIMKVLMIMKTLLVRS